MFLPSIYWIFSINSYCFKYKDSIASSSLTLGKTFLAQDKVGTDNTHQRHLLDIELSKYSFKAEVLAFCDAPIFSTGTPFKPSGSLAEIEMKQASCLA